MKSKFLSSISLVSALFSFSSQFLFPQKDVGSEFVLVGDPGPTTFDIVTEETTYESVFMSWDDDSSTWNHPWVMQRTTDNSWTDPTDMTDNQAADNTGAGTFRFMGLNAHEFTDMDGLAEGTTYYWRVATVTNLPAHTKSAATPTFSTWKYGSATTGTLAAAKKTVYDVVATYSADNTGATNTYTAINNALTAAQAAGGGIIYFPAGTYKLYPTDASISDVGGIPTFDRGDSATLYMFNITSDNITFDGAGSGSTTINQRLWNDNPMTEWLQIRDAGGTVTSVRRWTMFHMKQVEHFHITDLTIDGGATPVTTGKSPGSWGLQYQKDEWDLTHKLVTGSGQANSARFVLIDDLIAKNFRGEIFFMGGHGQGKWLIKNSTFGPTNSSALSFAAPVEVVNSTISNAANAAMECVGAANVPNPFTGVRYDHDYHVRGCTIKGLVPSGPMDSLPGDKWFIGIGIFNGEGTLQCVTDTTFEDNYTAGWFPQVEARDAFLFNWSFSGAQRSSKGGNAILDFGSRNDGLYGLAGGLVRVYALYGTVNMAHDMTGPKFVSRIYGSGLPQDNFHLEQIDLANHSGSIRTISLFQQEFSNLTTRQDYKWTDFTKSGPHGVTITNLQRAGAQVPTKTSVFP